jgi:hypothetical protein
MTESFLGPYLLYAAFAAWYFNFGGWYVLLMIMAGTGVSVYAIVKHGSQKEKRLAQREPTDENEPS